MCGARETKISKIYRKFKQMKISTRERIVRMFVSRAHGACSHRRRRLCSIKKWKSIQICRQLSTSHRKRNKCVNKIMILSYLFSRHTSHFIITFNRFFFTLFRWCFEKSLPIVNNNKVWRCSEHDEETQCECVTAGRPTLVCAKLMPTVNGTSRSFSFMRKNGFGGLFTRMFICVFRFRSSSE